MHEAEEEHNVHMPRNIVTNITNEVLENREPILEEPNNEAVISVAIKNGYDLSDGADAHQAAMDALIRQEWRSHLKSR